jgi:hypothetical protein
MVTALCKMEANLPQKVGLTFKAAAEKENRQVRGQQMLLSDDSRLPASTNWY